LYSWVWSDSNSREGQLGIPLWQRTGGGALRSAVIPAVSIYIGDRQAVKGHRCQTRPLNGRLG